MSKLWQKAFSLVLVFVVIVGMLPMNAFATETESSPVVREVSAETPTETPTEPEIDEAVVAVQAMIDALVMPDADEYSSLQSYEAALAELEAELRAIDTAAAELTEEQIAQVDTSNAESVTQAMNNFWLSQTPMMIVEGSGTQEDPYIYTVGEGETVNGAQLYTWITTNTLWSTSRHYYADDTQFTQGGTLGSTVSGDSSKTFGAGTYAIYGTTQKNYIQHNKDSSPKGYITIQEIKADEADMTLKEGPYTVEANLKTYSNLTAEKIIVAAGAISPTNKTITVYFRDYDNATWGGHDNWTELTADNLSTFLASDDMTSFRLVCGNTTKDITVTFAESRKAWSVSYTGGTISYTGDDALLAAVKDCLTVTGVGTGTATVTMTGSLPAAGITGEVAFSVSVPEDDNNLAYSGSINVAVTMPTQQYSVSISVNDSTLGKASVDCDVGVYGTTVTVTATPADTDGSDGSATYVKSITVNGTPIEGNTFTIGEEDAEVVVTFAERSISISGEHIVYMNSNKTMRDQYISNLTADALDYTLNGDGDQNTVYLEMQYTTALSGPAWAKPAEISQIYFTAFDEPEVNKQVRIVWPADGNLPEVMVTVTVTIKDSYRTITYWDGESKLSSADTECLATTTTAAAVTKEGYTFKEWNTAADGSGTAYAAGAEITMGEDNVILYAQWTVNTYTVTWVDGNGDTLETDTVEYGVIPEYNGENPTKTQTVSTVYTWKNGWDKEVKAVTGDTTYTATFTESAREYTISWDTDGDGTVDKTTQVAYGTDPTAPAHANRKDENLSPNGWSPEIVAVTGEATYTAQYSKDTVYKVEFVVDGNEYETQYVNVTQGETVTCPTDPDKDYAVFGGWDKEIVNTPTADTVYTAIWLEDKNNNNVADSNETATIKVNITGNGTVTLSGGFEITDNGDGTYTVIYDSTAEGGNVITVTATPKDTVATDGSVDYLIPAPETVTVANGETTTMVAQFGTETIHVAGSGTVYVNANLTGGEKLNDLKNKVLTAAGIDTADAADYTVFMVTGNGTYDVETDNFLEKLDMYTRFNVGDTQGFVIQKNNGAVVVSDTISIEVKDSRLILDITASQETIEFSGKTEVADIQETVKGLFTIKTTNPETGEEITVQVSDSYITWAPAYAWPTDAETKEFTVTVRVNLVANGTYQNAPSASVTVTLTDTTILYTVKFENEKGESNEVAVPENTLVAAPTAPTHEYYNFVGWYNDEAAYSFDAAVVSDLTLTAKWSPKVDNNGNGIADQEEKYTVIFVLGNGEENVTCTDLAWGAATPTIDNPTWEGHNFKGWDVTPAETVTAPASGNIITYTAVWTENHVVTFDDRGNPTYVEVENGNQVTEPTAPIWDADHDFLGWYNGDVKYDFTQLVTESLTLTAKWIDDFNHNNIDDSTEDHYTVIYNVDGVLTTFEDILTGMPTPTVTEPTKTGYLFNGWNPEVAATVTTDATYVAQWLNDSNSNGVDDALETITVAITGNGKVTIGLKEYADGDTYIYDSTGDKSVTIKAVPITTLHGLKYVSSSYVTGISVDGNAAELTYAMDYTVTHSFTAEGNQTVSIAFTDIAFVYNGDRVLKFYPGMPDVKNEDVYNAIVDTPNLPGKYTIQYKAREATSVPVTLTGLGLGDIVDGLLNAAGLGTFNLELPALWLDVDVETGEMVQDSVSLDQAVKQYLTADNVKAAWDENGIDGIRALLTKVIDAATYYGAHNFGYNATEAETVTEEIKITYGQDAYYIEGETTVNLRDTRLPSYVMGNNVSVMYKDYTDENLWTLIAPYAADASGAKISTDITCLDITDPYTYEGYGVAEYELIFKFAGNDDYKPCEGTFTVTVTKAPASFDIPNTTVNYGDSYTMLDESYVTVGNKYGNKSEVTESTIQFIIGLDVADVDVNADGVSGLNGQVQLILSADLQSLLDGIIEAAGGDPAAGTDMTLSELVAYLKPIQDTSLEALKQALNAIIQITETGDITIQLGGALPTDTGAYLYGAVSTSSNYETAFDVAYIIIKPNATQVYLDWNYSDTNGVFTYELTQAVDMGASAYAEADFATINDAATALVQNLLFGVNANGELVTALVPQGGTLEASKLATGAYTQLAFVAEFGNEFYYAVPIVRAFVVVPNAVNVEIGDEADSNQATFDGKAHSLDVAVSYDGSAFEVSNEFLTVRYIGVRTNMETYDSDKAPTHAGVYAVSAIYIQRDADGEIIAIGVDVESLTIKPADSTISVTGGTFEYDDEAHGVTVESTRADVTIISGTVDFDGNVTGLGIEDVTGVLNVDVPAWLDEYLAENHPHAYANGLTKADFARKLDEYRAKLTEYGLSEESIDSLIQLLNDIPADVQIKFNDVDIYEEPGVYAYIGIVTDSDYMPSYDTGLVVIQRKDLLLDMKDTTVIYDGNEHFVDVDCEPVTDYITIIIDRENNIGNIILEDDMMALLDIVEESLGRELSESITILELKTAVEDVLTKIANIEQLPIDMTSVLNEILTALNRLPDTSIIYINGKLPVDAGEYEFYGASISAEYTTQLTEGALTIQKRDVTITLDEQTKVYGEADPELTYTVEGLVDGDDLNIVASRAEGDNVGTYAITATAENTNYNITVVDGELTIDPKAITADNVALNGSLTYNGVVQIQYITITDGITYEITGNRATNAGSYTLTVTGIGNYTGTVELDWSIAQKSVTITLDDQNKVYGESNPELTYTVEGLVDGDDLNIVASRAEGDNVGTYAITATAENTNYNITVVDGELTIDPKAITADDVALSGSLTYNGVVQIQYITITNGITYEITGNRATDAGSYTLTVTGIGNYTGTVELDWSIAKAQAEIIVDTTPITVTYGQTVALPTATSNFGTIECDMTAADLVDVGTYTVTYTVTGTNNYEGVSKTVKVTILKNIHQHMEDMGIQSTGLIEDNDGATFAYVKGFVYGSSVEKLIADLEALDGATLVKFTDRSGTEISVGTVSTGMEFFVEINGVTHRRVIVIMGDVNGDGAILADDYVRIKNQIMDENEALVDEYALAADIDNDGQILANDYRAIKLHIMEEKPIEQTSRT